MKGDLNDDPTMDLSLSLNHIIKEEPNMKDTLSTGDDVLMVDDENLHHQPVTIQPIPEHNQLTPQQQVIKVTNQQRSLLSRFTSRKSASPSLYRKTPKAMGNSRAVSPSQYRKTASASQAVSTGNTISQTGGPYKKSALANHNHLSRVTPIVKSHPVPETSVRNSPHNDMKDSLSTVVSRNNMKSSGNFTSVNNALSYSPATITKVDSVLSKTSDRNGQYLNDSESNVERSAADFSKKSSPGPSEDRVNPDSCDDSRVFCSEEQKYHSRRLKMAEMEHEQKMKNLKIKEQILLLQKRKLETELMALMPCMKDNNEHKETIKSESEINGNFELKENDSPARNKVHTDNGDETSDSLLKNSNEGTDHEGGDISHMTC